MRSSVVVGVGAVACLGLVASAVALVAHGSDTVRARAEVLVSFHGARCTIRDAFILDGSVVAVCREGYLVPFYRPLSCSGPPVGCRMGLLPLCFEHGARVTIPAGHPSDKLGSLLP